jgi:hypothetical protein
MIPAPVKPSASIDLFQRLDIRVGTIVAVEDLPKSKNLVPFDCELTPTASRLSVRRMGQAEGSAALGLVAAASALAGAVGAQ